MKTVLTLLLTLIPSSPSLIPPLIPLVRNKKYKERQDEEERLKLNTYTLNNNNNNRIGVCNSACNIICI